MKLKGNVGFLGSKLDPSCQALEWLKFFLGYFGKWVSITFQFLSTTYFFPPYPLRKKRIYFTRLKLMIL